MQRSEARQRLNRRSVLTLQAILCHDSGIATRHFAMPDIERVFSLTPDELNAGFRREAPRLAARALTAALTQAGENTPLSRSVFIGRLAVDTGHDATLRKLHHQLELKRRQWVRFKAARTAS